MEKLANNFEKFDLIWILFGIYILINLIVVLPVEDFLYNSNIISNPDSLNFFVEFIMELIIVFICLNIFLISIYNYKITDKKENLFLAVGFLFAGISNLAHAILVYNKYLAYGSSSEMFAIYNKIIVSLILLLSLILKRYGNKEKYYSWSLIITSVLFSVAVFMILNNLWNDLSFTSDVVNIIIIVILTFNILFYLRQYLINNDETILILLKGFMFLFIAEMLYTDEVQIFTKPYFMAQSIKLVGFIYIFQSNFSKELKDGISAQNQLELKNTKLKLHQDRIKDLRAQRHDFKNELQTIFTMLQLGKAKKAREYIKRLHLDLNDTQGKGKTADNDLAPVLISKKQEAKQKNIEFTTDIRTDLEEIIVPENKVLKVLFNLIDNAIDAIEGISTSDKHIEVRLIDAGDNVELIVYNSKPIIPDDVLKNIFSPGFSTKGNNRGFGLYIVKSLLTDYGGDIKAESKKELGTKFICYLPKNY
ncbi:ATP-binding protein [Halanaerobacter jeridensis]|uniref:histidine kinase n=1 Tax=Halanaerobacter jeridensis TaxID=706427 RepID=A0A939BNT5_9FIRM|nr:ATP-binding protein [Halanaerobacter jeridensis]MBM7556042.1 signal transduction histidine kinase [Halanaerobacter jeridensis]